MSKIPQTSATRRALVNAALQANGLQPIAAATAQPAKPKASTGLQPIPAGSYSVATPAMPSVSQATFNAMQAVINTLTAAQPNVVPNAVLYQTMDGTMLENGLSLVSILSTLQNVGAIKYCELTHTWYLPFIGAKPLNQLVTILA